MLKTPAAPKSERRRGAEPDHRHYYDGGHMRFDTTRALWRSLASLLATSYAAIPWTASRASEIGAAEKSS